MSRYFRWGTACLAEMMFFIRLSAKEVIPPAMAARITSGRAEKPLVTKVSSTPRSSQKVWSFLAFSVTFRVLISRIGAYMTRSSISIVIPL